MGDGRNLPPGSGSPVAPLHRYTSPDEDSARWWDFAFRPGDIVVSTRSKSGTTWVQMICLLLVFGTPDLPDRLSALSPWLDWLVRPREDVMALLEGQSHRRVIKTHTPLDGVPLDDRATYVVVGRHPLDMAVSLYHHSDNIDRRRMAELVGVPEVPRRPRPPLREWLLGFVDWDGDPRANLDTLPGVMLHLSDAWARRHHGNIVLVHFDDLVSDLDRAMRKLAEVLGVAVDEGRWPALVHAATFGAMRERRSERAGGARRAEGPGGVLPPRRLRGWPGALARRRVGPLRRPRREHGTGGDARLAAPDWRPLSVPIVPDDKDWTWVLQRPCPECGFDASALAPEGVAPLLRANVSAWVRILERPADELRRRPADDRWAPLEYACHVRDVCLHYRSRLELMLREDDPLYPNWDQDATAVEERYREQDPAEVSAQLRGAADKLASAFEGVTGRQWERRGRRSDGAGFSVAGFGRYFIHDPVHHLFDVTGRRGA